MTLLNLRAGLTVLAAVLLAATGTAHAAVYKGSWDPVYGAPFKNLGWRGEATFDVADDCHETGQVVVNGSCTATVTDALVEFYRVDEALQPTRARIAYDVDMPILNLRFNASGALIGIDTGLFASVSPTSVLGSNDDLFQGRVPTFALAFNIGTPYNGPLLYWTRGLGCGGNGQSQCNDTNGTTGDSIPTFTITREGVAVVPEPGSLALVLGGLAAVAGSGRLRRRRG